MKAIITCLIAGEYTLYDISKKTTVVAKARGIFRNTEVTPKVGDLVEYVEGSPHAIIMDVMKRRNDFVRPAIANIDQAFIVTSIKEPNFNLNLLDKMICVFEYQNIMPILIFSKMDLLTSTDDATFMAVKDYYEKIGYQVLLTTTKEPLTTEKIKPYLKDKISIITGQSGVGKSSILNSIDNNIALATNEISKALNRGKHTTRFTKLYNLCDGWIADSPGFGMVELADMNEISISQSFVEFFALAKTCKYKGCLHINEPFCKVREAVNNGTILKSRYDNYLQFIKETKKQRKW